MGCRLLGTKPLPGPMVMYINLVLHLRVIVSEIQIFEWENLIKNVVCKVLVISLDPSRHHF